MLIILMFIVIWWWWVFIWVIMELVNFILWGLFIRVIVFKWGLVLIISFFRIKIEELLVGFWIVKGIRVGGCLIIFGGVFFVNWIFFWFLNRMLIFVFWEVKVLVIDLVLVWFNWIVWVIIFWVEGKRLVLVKIVLFWWLVFSFEVIRM